MSSCDRDRRLNLNHKESAVTDGSRACLLKLRLASCSSGENCSCSDRIWPLLRLSRRRSRADALTAAHRWLGCGILTERFA